MLKNLINRIFHKLAYVSPGGYTLRIWFHRMRGVDIGKNVWISLYVYLDELHPDMITIQDNCTIGFGTLIYTHLYWGSRRANYNEGKVTIEKDVFIGPNCVILPNVRIGEGSVIKAGTVVTKNVPPKTLWGLPPAKALGSVTVPLTNMYDYKQFARGIKPIKVKGGFKPYGN